MNTNKLDKLVDQIFSKMGELKQGVDTYYGFVNESGELICYKVVRSFIVTKNAPHLDVLRYSLDDVSFKYLMDQVGNRLINLYPNGEKVAVEYKELKGLSYIFDYIG